MLLVDLVAFMYVWSLFDTVESLAMFQMFLEVYVVYVIHAILIPLPCFSIVLAPICMYSRTIKSHINISADLESPPKPESDPLN